MLVILIVDGLQHVGVNNVVIPAVHKIVGVIVYGDVIPVLVLFAMSAVILNHVVVVLLHAQVDRVLMSVDLFVNPELSALVQEMMVVGLLVL
jgi:hypothetical protein